MIKITKEDKDKISYPFQRGYEKLSLEDVRNIMSYSFLSKDPNNKDVIEKTKSLIFSYKKEKAYRKTNDESQMGIWPRELVKSCIYKIAKENNTELCNPNELSSKMYKERLHKDISLEIVDNLISKYWDEKQSEILIIFKTGTASKIFNEIFNYNKHYVLEAFRILGIKYKEKNYDALGNRVLKINAKELEPFANLNNKEFSIWNEQLIKRKYVKKDKKNEQDKREKLPCDIQSKARREYEEVIIRPRIERYVTQDDEIIALTGLNFDLPYGDRKVWAIERNKKVFDLLKAGKPKNWVPLNSEIEDVLEGLVVAPKGFCSRIGYMDLDFNGQLLSRDWDTLKATISYLVKNRLEFKKPTTIQITYSCRGSTPNSQEAQEKMLNKLYKPLSQGCIYLPSPPNDHYNGGRNSERAVIWRNITTFIPY